MQLPDAVDPALVGSYPALAGAGGGYVWDEVLEYRVWLSPVDEDDEDDEDDADDEDDEDDADDGSDYYYAFATLDEAKDAAQRLRGAGAPLALVLQREYIEESDPGEYRHVRHERVTEWPVEFLSRPRRDERTIPDFLAPDAPGNRLEILRGQAPRPQ